MCGAVCAFLATGCAVELEDVADALESAIDEPGGLVDCPRAAWSFLEPSAWVIDGLWIGGEYVLGEVLIGEALADPENPLVELRLELAAIANNAAQGFDVPDEIEAAAASAQDWLSDQRSGADEVTADVVGRELADRLRGSSLEATLSCLDAIASGVSSAF